MKSYKKSLLALLTLFLSVSISTVGFSSFVINNKLNTTSTIQINKNNKDEKVKISFKYQVCTGYKETEGNEEGTGHNNVNIGNTFNTDKTKYDEFFKLVNDWCETGFSGDIEASSTPYKTKGKGKYSGYNVYIKVSRKIEAHKGLFDTYYRGEYTITVKKVNVQLAYDFPSTSTSITIDKGSSIPTSFIKNSFYKDPNSKDYEFVGFKEVGSDGNPSDSFISLDKTFITDTTLYAIFNSKTLNGDTKYNLSDTINNTSSGTVDFNAGVAVGKLNLSNDFTWLDSEKKVFLGGANTKTTINKGVKARFLFNDGSESKKNEFGSDSVYVEPVEKNRQYTVVLQNDLIINGQMQVEGNYGVNTSGATQGVIAKEYMCIDLNGHNITINNGGKLISNGLIIDSVGTGQINVEGGGYLRTLAVIHDYRGGTMTQSYVNNDVFPFQVYQLPYLRCKARVKYDQTNGWGSLNGYVNAQAFRDVVAGDLTILKGQQEFELNFIGPSNSNYFIKLDKPSTYNEDSYVDVIGYKENSIDKTSANKLYSISQRIKIIINKCSVSIGEFKFNIKVSGISISVDTSKYSLPISSFFDLEIKNSFLTLDKRIKFLPGSSLIVDNKSTTLLSYDKKAKRAGQISVLDKSYYYYDKNYKYVTTDLIKLADMSGSNATEANISGDGYGQQVFKAQSFQKYKSNPNVQIKGTLLFKTGNDSGMDYQLSGTINLSKIGYTSDGTLSSSTIVNSDNPFSELNKQSVKVITYGYDYMIGNCSNNSHVKGFSRPLVSNETAYYNDGTNSYVGTYEDDGIFRANSKTYYFNNDGKYKTNDTTLPTLKECDYDSNSKIITDNNQQYIYIASMYCKLTSTDNKTGTVDHTRLSGNATVDSKVKYDNTLGKWVRG